MPPSPKRGLLLSLLAALLAAPATAAPAGIEGVWRTPGGTEITIAPCPPDWCGYISRIVVPDNIRQRLGPALDRLRPDEYTDANNPDPKLRQRPMLGLRILLLQPQPEPGRFAGEIYNAEDGRTYAGRLVLLDADTVRLTGCAMLIFCRSERWVRVGPLPPADSSRP